jgi:hypothetical protein
MRVLTQRWRTGCALCFFSTVGYETAPSGTPLCADVESVETSPTNTCVRYYSSQWIRYGCTNAAKGPDGPPQGHFPQVGWASTSTYYNGNTSTGVCPSSNPSAKFGGATSWTPVGCVGDTARGTSYFDGCIQGGKYQVEFTFNGTSCAPAQMYHAEVEPVCTQGQVYDCSTSPATTPPLPLAGRVTFSSSGCQYDPTNPPKANLYALNICQAGNTIYSCANGNFVATSYNGVGCNGGVSGVTTYVADGTTCQNGNQNLYSCDAMSVLASLETTAGAASSSSTGMQNPGSSSGAAASTGHGSSSGADLIPSSSSTGASSTGASSTGACITCAASKAVAPSFASLVVAMSLFVTTR